MTQEDLDRFSRGWKVSTTLSELKGNLNYLNSNDCELNIRINKRKGIYTCNFGNMNNFTLTPEQVETILSMFRDSISVSVDSLEREFAEL